MRSILTRVGLAAAMLLSLTAMTAGTTFAATSVDSPNPVQADTTQLNWTGQGTTSGQLDTPKCGDNADFGAGGAQNGATADDYLLWIFSTDGGSVSGDPTITINGDTYSNAYFTGGVWQIVTPSYDLSSISAHTTFAVADTGNGSWVLTISHGCVAPREDQQINPQGSIGGPCADPSYYGVFDNSQTTSQSITFRFQWYNSYGLRTRTKLVPAGAIYTTWIHWTKRNTLVTVDYLDPTTSEWVNLATVTATHGRFPPCQYTPGWSQPV